MADKVHADTTAIIQYAGELSGMTAGKGGEHGKGNNPMVVSLTGSQPLHQMSEVMIKSFVSPIDQFQEALEVAGYNADNVAAFLQFIPDVTKGINAMAMQAQAVGVILHYTDGVSAADMANILAYAEGDPSAKRPDGIPTDALGKKTLMDAEMEASENQSSQPDAIANPNDPNAKTFTEPGASMTTTMYADGSYRVVSYYTTYNADGSSTTHTETKYYKANGDPIANSGETEDTEVGNGYQTVTRHEGNTTSTTTTHDNGSVDIKTSTEDGDGKPQVTTAHVDPPKDSPAPNDSGPVQNWEHSGNTDGSADGHTYAGY